MSGRRAMYPAGMEVGDGREIAKGGAKEIVVVIAKTNLKSANVGLKLSVRNGNIGLYGPNALLHARNDVIDIYDS